MAFEFLAGRVVHEFVELGVNVPPIRARLTPEMVVRGLPRHVSAWATPLPTVVLVIKIDFGLRLVFRHRIEGEERENKRGNSDERSESVCFSESESLE